MSSSSRVLKDKGFMLQERGEIDVKGKGRMSTYFLEGNLTSTEHEIMGRSVKEADSGRASVQSARDCSTEAALYRPAIQRVQSEDRNPAVPMEYGDSLTDPQPPVQLTDPQPQARAKSLKGKPRDSESYGSLHSDNKSVEGGLPNPDHQLTRATLSQSPTPIEAEALPSTKHIRTSFCVVL
ncbi:guanylate cyclase soluble subunit beta-2 [Salmo salar]|uniref:Guanylate cyclase soluble subunit beta-2 n=1 Tax=Salmo salar TaxID=8030 RepID=A0ABM3FAE2_SALSA|nr:guanylate cyclase soluble subunit beta-2-like [Salmo salar]